HIDTLLQSLLQKAGINKNDIDYYAVNPGGMKILEACEKALQISTSDTERSYRILKDFGNMSSVTILFVLNLFLSELSHEDDRKKLISFAFGPGLTMESMLAEFCAG